MCSLVTYTVQLNLSLHVYFISDRIVLKCVKTHASRIVVLETLTQSRLCGYWSIDSSLHGRVLLLEDNSAQNQLGPCQLSPHKNRPMPTRPKIQNSAQDNSAQFLVL